MLLQKIFALLSIIIALPIFVLAAFLIFLTDFSNPIYCGERVGKNYVRFNLFKLRTMTIYKSGPLIDVTSTSASDSRITFLGRFLRNTKIDEIPQLVNVLFGQIAFVGPRPNVYKNGVEKYHENEKKILEATPGITDFSSIVFADEGEILKNSNNPDNDYDSYIRYWKNSLALIYIKHRSLYLDLYIIYLTLLNFFNRDKALNLISRKIISFSRNYDDVSKVCLRYCDLEKKQFSNNDFDRYCV